MSRGRAACLLSLSIALTGCGGSGASGDPSPPSSVTPSASAAAKPTPRASSTPRPTPTLPAGVAQIVDLGGADTWGIATAGDTIWVETGDFTIHQLDGATGELIQSVQGWMPTVVGTTIWYQSGNALFEADAATGETIATYVTPLPGTVVHDGTLWARSEEQHLLARVDLASGEVTGQLTLPDGEPKWVEVWEGAVWVAIDGSDVVLRVDPATMTVTEAIPAGSRPHSMIAAFGSLWVIEHGISELLRLAPDGAIQARIAGPGINVALAVADDALWASTPTAIVRLDPATNEITETIELGPRETYGMAFSQGSLWVTSGMDSLGLYQIPIG